MPAEKPKRPKAPGKAVAKARVPKPAIAKPAVAKPAATKAAPKKAASAKASAAPSKRAPVKAAARKPAAKAAAKPPAKRAAVKSKLEIPPLLLEGDRSSVALPSGPGERYALGTAARVEAFPGGAELPESYGTRRLLLAARDPHWLYAHWDFTNEQLSELNAASSDGHLVLRVFKNQVAGKPCVEQPVHPESRNWFVHVPAAGTCYVAELGYYTEGDSWNGAAVSGATLTPVDTVSSDTTVRFETIPVEVPFKKLLQLVKAAVARHVPLVEALQQLRVEGFKNHPVPQAVAAATWTPAQESALAQIISIDEVRRVWMGSMEITELIRRQLEHELSSQAAAALAHGGPAGAESGGGELGGVSSVSSPFGGVGKRRGFWFNVNAELIIYGATEPDAKVTLGGRAIQLRKDGTFSFRFALPDGDYSLPVAATAADGAETRSAHLQFRRATGYGGDVGAHPQDAALKSPRVENVA